MRKLIIFILVALIAVFTTTQIYNHFDEYNSLKSKKLKSLNQETVNGKSYMEISNGRRVFNILSDQDKEIIVHAIKKSTPFRKEIMLATTNITVKLGNIQFSYNQPFVIFHDEPKKLYKLRKKGMLKVDRLLLKLEEEYNEKNK